MPSIQQRHCALPGFPLLVISLVMVLVGIQATLAAASAAPPPIAAYSFDEGTGTTLTDSAGNHDGTIQGASWTSSGKYGSALDFDGRDDLVSIADASDLDLTRTFTLEAWVRPDALTHGSTVIDKLENPSSPSGYMLTAQASGKPTGFVADSGTIKSAAGTSALPTTPPTWTHLAFTSDGANLRLYVDGKLVATKTAIAAKATAANLEIGHSQYLPSIYFDGLIDEVRIYDETLSEGQIQADRDTAVGLDQTPIAAYSFDEGTGTTLTDSAGNHDGTIQGASWTSSGKYGSALDFDGRDDLVSIADASDLDLTRTFTLEAWVRLDSYGSTARPIVMKTKSDTTDFYKLSATGSGIPTGIVANATTSAKVDGPSRLPTGTWTHLAFTSDGANLCLYVDGKLVATKTAIVATANDADLQIGHNQVSGADFDGLIDEVRLYDETLAQSQIQSDMDTAVQPPAPQEVTTTVLDTGASSERVSSVPITPAGQETVIYSLAVPSLTADEVLRATGNLEVTNTYAYDVTDSVRLVLGSSASDTSGTVVTPWTAVQQTQDMDNWTLPIDGDYRATSNLGTQYLKLVLIASSASARSGDTLTVVSDSGRLAATRYTPASGPMSQPTHQLQPLVGPISQQITSLPVDSVWRTVLSRRMSEISAEDIIDFSSQLGVQNTSGATVQLESKLVLSATPTSGGPNISLPSIDRLLSGMSSTRLIHSNTVQITDPGRRYLNLWVRAVPVSGSPSPLTITTGSGALEVLRLKPNPGDPTASVGKGSRENNPYWDDSASLNSVPFADESTPQPRVVNSIPLYELRKGDVIRGRGVVEADLAGANSAKVKVALVIAEDQTAVSGDTVAKPVGDMISSAAQIHTIDAEGTYVAPKTSYDTKFLNLVVYASRAPAYSGETLSVPNASVTYARSLPTVPFSAGFEDGSLDQFFQYGGELSVSSDVAREGRKSLKIDADSSSICEFCGDPEGIRRASIAPPDGRASGGYFGEDDWYGFSVYFPDGFRVPKPDPIVYFDGLIDEVRLYDQPLSESQIVDDRDGKYANNPTVPIAAYSFDERSGTTAGDSSENNHDGAIDGATWTSSGKYGSALDFDGRDDLVRIADANDLDLTDSFTLEAWVHPDTLSYWSSAISKAEDADSPSGYLLLAQGFGKPGGIVADSGTLKTVNGPSALPTGAWSHLALTSDGTDLRLYIDGRLISTRRSAIAAAMTGADLTIGASEYNPAKAGTWDIFAQWHHSDEGLDCETSLPPPIAFNARYWKAKGHTNPGETETATPVAGDYLEVGFNGGEINANCDQVVNPTSYYVVASLERDHWYDFVLHTKWAPTVDGSGDSLSEVWIDGEQVLGDLTTPVLVPNLFWHGTPDIFNTNTYWGLGLYRGPSAEDPPTQFYIDAVRRGNSYNEVTPGQ